MLKFIVVVAFINVLWVKSKDKNNFVAVVGN